MHSSTSPQDCINTNFYINININININTNINVNDSININNNMPWGEMTWSDPRFPHNPHNLLLLGIFGVLAAYFLVCFWLLPVVYFCSCTCRCNPYLGIFAQIQLVESCAWGDATCSARPVWGVKCRENFSLRFVWNCRGPAHLFIYLLFQIAAVRIYFMSHTFKLPPFFVVHQLFW